MLDDLGGIGVPWQERPADNNNATSWRVRLASLRNVLPLFKLLWEISPRLLAANLALRILRACISFLALWIPKLILDAIVMRPSGTSRAPTHLWSLVALEAVVAVGGDVMARANALCDSLLADRFTTRVSVDVIRHAASLDLASFESPLFYDTLERTRNQNHSRLALLSTVFSLVQDSVSCLVVSAGLVVFAPWLVMCIICASIPALLNETYHVSLSYSSLFKLTPYRRFLDYLCYLGASAESAKEIKLFGLGGYLSDTYLAVATRIHHHTKRLAIRRAISGSVLNIASMLVYYAGYAYIVIRAVSGGITIGMFTFLVGSLLRVKANVGRIASELVGICEQTFYLRDLMGFFAVTPSVRSGSRAVLAPRPAKIGIEFEDVSFEYPGGSEAVVRHVTFALAPGETLALVGSNGAGKTTLIKLLLRLYDPTGGRILLDGVDLREYDLDDFRKTATVFFQDYVRYEMRVRDNIAFGDLSILADSPLLAAASFQSGAHEMIDRLPRKFDQVLGHRFEGAVALSSGEWQKLALARAYARDAQLVVLDEPASNLDARAECDLFRKLSTTLSRRMLVLISHRFSTVRFADRIIVLDRGEILENGSHSELMQLGGRYAEAFLLQAEAFR